MLAGCPGNGNEDDTSTSFGTPTGSGSDGTATSSVDPETGSSGDVDETSTGGTGCTAGLPGCTCLPDDTCMGDAVCEAGICQDVSDDTTAGEDTGTTDGPDPVCGNGMPEPGLLCFGTSVPQAMGAGTIGITIDNFDASPFLDIVTANRDANTVAIRLGQADGQFGSQDAYPTGTGPIAIGSGQFLGDENLDVVTVNVTSLDVSILAGTATEDFEAPVNISLGIAPLTPTDLEVVDLDDDGDADILVTESTGSNVHVIRFEKGMALPIDTYAVAGGPAAIHAADFSGNLVPDVITANGAGGTVSLLLGNGQGQLGEPTSASAGTSPNGASSGDFNGDDTLDAILSNPGGMVTIRLGNGLGGFGGQLPFPIAGSPTALVAADFNLDGISDVAVATSENNVHVLVGNGSGNLTEEAVIPVGMAPQDIVAADLNDDGMLDIVTANVTAGGVSVILSDA